MTAAVTPAFSNEPGGHDEPPRRAVEFPFATIGKVILVAFALWAIFWVSTIITLMLVAIVLASPSSRWSRGLSASACRDGLPRRWWCCWY